MAATAMTNVFMVGIYLAMMCKFSFARAQLQEQTANSLDSSSFLYQMMGDFYEIKHKNKLLGERIEILEDNQGTLETADEAKIVSHERRIETLEEALQLQQATNVDQSERIEMLEEKLESMETFTKDSFSECENQRKVMELELDNLWNVLDNQNASTFQAIADLERKMTETAIQEPPKPKECPSTYVYYADLNLCWRLEKTKKMDFLTANWNCYNEGGHLIVLDSMAKVQFIQYYLSATASMIDAVYVGATDVMEKGKFAWINGKPVVTLPWHGSEPSKGSNEHCVAMSNANKFDFFDRNCNFEYYFLCQISF